MNIDWNIVFTSTITFFLLVILKTLFDIHIARIVVRYFSWIPVRNLFRSKPPNISGIWEQTWGNANSKIFSSEIDRHGFPEIKQLGNYCYGEYISKGITYVIFGRLVDIYFVGDWYDKNDPQGYFGAFQLEVINKKEMRGRWVGHSKTHHEVQSDVWVWRKVN